MAEFGRRAGFRIQWVKAHGGSNPPFGRIKIHTIQMKEIKPRIALSSNRERRGWGLSGFLVILISFAIGVLVGMRINSIYLLEEEKTKTTEKHEVNKVQTGLGDKPADAVDTDQSLATTVEVESGIVKSNTGQLTSGLNDLKKSEGTLEQKKGSYVLERFTVQVGAFTNLNRAETAQNELIEKGYGVVIVPYVNSLSEKWYILQIGKFNSSVEATEYANNYIRREGTEAIVERLE